MFMFLLRGGRQHDNIHLLEAAMYTPHDGHSVALWFECCRSIIALLVLQRRAERQLLESNIKRYPRVSHWTLLYGLRAQAKRCSRTTRKRNIRDRERRHRTLTNSVPKKGTHSVLRVEDFIQNVPRINNIHGTDTANQPRRHVPTPAQ